MEGDNNNNNNNNVEEEEIEVERKYENQGWAWPIVRPVPFSHAQKKVQQKEKKQRRKDKDNYELNHQHQSRDELLLSQVNSLLVSNDKVVETIFEKESQEEIESRKKKGFEPLDLSHRENVWGEEFESAAIVDMPVRPPYVKGESVGELDERERSEFNKWMNDIIVKYGSRLNYFEMNLEVWRQLWRVVERSDILLLVVDARFPRFHFPPSLYNYVVNELKKPMILILNKTDIVDKRIVDEWEKYFMEKYPSLKIVRFSSMPPVDGELDIERLRKLEKGRKRNKYENGDGRKALLEAIQSFEIKKASKANVEKAEAEDTEGKKSKDDIITIGFVGQPNVGKSSLVNGLAKKKVVSTSSTPGHTKHFQTIYITLNDNNDNNNPRFKLCDCPGLVFPAIDIPKELQVLSGVYPISQVREVYSSIRYLAERVPLEKIYNLKAPYFTQWSPYLICEAYALKRGYREAKSGQADGHRAGGEILRNCLDGHIVISWPPPGVHLPPSSYSSSEGEVATTSSSEEDEEVQEETQEEIEETQEGSQEETEIGESEEQDENQPDKFWENQKKKRERKMKKKQQILEMSAQ